MDWAGGALSLASTAVDAGVGVDFVVLSTFWDRLGGANSGASSAGDAGVCDYVSHCLVGLRWIKNFVIVELSDKGNAFPSIVKIFMRYKNTKVWKIKRVELSPDEVNKARQEYGKDEILLLYSRRDI